MDDELKDRDVLSDEDQARNEVVAKIQERLDKQREQEDQEAASLYGVTPAKEETATATAAAEDGEAETGKDAAPEDAEVVLKVDGQEIPVPKSEVVKAGEGDPDAGKRILQMQLAAQRRLDDSKAIHAQAQAYAQQVLAAAQALQQQRQAQPSTPDDAQLLNAIRFGDDSEGLRALQLLEERAAQRVTAAAGQQLTPQHVQAIIEDRLDYARSLEVLQRDFSDIANDPQLSVLAGSLFQQKRAAGDSRSRTELLSEVAADIRKWRGEPVKTSPEKLERKRTMQVVDSASARTPARAEERPKTTSEIIAEMQAARSR